MKMTENMIKSKPKSLFSIFSSYQTDRGKFMQKYLPPRVVTQLTECSFLRKRLKILIIVFQINSIEGLLEDFLLVV